jgi:tetratricopeptide (TPR) repeat protein
VTQAARAELDPARARIESCGADPVLVRLCLNCLMPGRAGRPTNAEEVAKAVHAYITTTEERAQKAELEAIEARIKAAEERRAKRLTMALGGTILVALLGGGGAVYWIGRERAERMEQTRTAVEAAHGESIELGQAGKPEEALGAARRALSIAETGGADAALLERARGFVAKAELDVGAAERARSLTAQDETLRSRLIDLRLAQISTISNRARERDLDAEFTRAFQDYGVDLEGADVVPALKRIRERNIAEEVAIALDDWGRLRRKVHGEKSEKAENLFLLAMDLDADPTRQRMRQAIAHQDLDVMLDLAAPENLHKLAPGSIFVLSAALWDGYPERRPDVYRMFDQALKLYPGDYVLQSVGGFVYRLAGRAQSSLSCRTAALSLRPHDITAQLSAADAIQFVGHLTEAESAYRAILVDAPTNAEAHYNLGTVLILLGEFEDARKSIARSLEIEEHADRRVDFNVASYFTGSNSSADLARLYESAGTAYNVATYLYVLVDHPDPARRDPAFVLRELQGSAAVYAGELWFHVIEAVARIRVEDWPGALAAIEGRFVFPDVLIVTPMAYDFIRSLIYSHLGRDGEARECYTRGMAKWNEETGGNPAAWEKSDVMRWRRSAEAVLAK